MTREEMLKVLHTIPVSVRLTALVSEGALECQYMTSKGTKEEWIGIYEWPVSIIKEAQGAKYMLKIDDKTYSFDDYQSFSSFFEQKWIGEDVYAWENYCDQELEAWLELIDGCKGIPVSGVE